MSVLGDAWSSATELQELVDALAAEIGRPVGIDDQRFEAIAYSPHEHDYDDVRAASILRRRAPHEVVEWLDDLGVRRATGELHIPANAELGMVSRVCIPLRCAEITLGYLWLIDEPGPIGPDELARARASSRRAAALVYRIRLLKRDDRKQEQTLVAALLHGEAGEARAAAATLVETGLLEAASAYAVLAVRPCSADAPASTEAVGSQVTDCIERVRRMLPPHRMLAALLNDEGTAILACTADEDAQRRAETLHELTEEACRPLGVARVVVGIGSAASPDGLREAYRQAREAAALAETVTSLGELVRWDQLGAYGTILRMRRGSELLPAAVPEPLWRLLRSPDAAPLVETLEVYLESAADVSTTAARIYVHRSSLYGRLRRIEELAEVDLRDGDDRLVLHLGLRLWRMAGSPPPPPLLEPARAPAQADDPRAA